MRIIRTAAGPARCRLPKVDRVAGTPTLSAPFAAMTLPQVAIVGIGTPRLYPMIHDGAVAARRAARLTLAADHRVSDGHRGALFLRAIDKALQSPDTL